MAKMSEILISILIICIIVFLFVFYKDKLYQYKIVKKIVSVFDIDDSPQNTQTIPPIKNDVKESTDNFFATEYEVSDEADDAISDALKNMMTE